MAGDASEYERARTPASTGGGGAVADGVDNTALGDLLGITEAALDTADPVSLARGYLGAMRRAAFRSWRTAPAVAKYGARLGLTGAHLVTRALGHPLPEVVQPDPRDQRFRDPTWIDNIWYRGGL